MYSKVWFTSTTKRLIGHTTKTVLLWNDRKFSIWTHWLVNQGISTSAIYQKGSSSYENQTVIKSTDIWQIIWLSLFQKIWYSFFPSRHSLLAEHYPPPAPPPPQSPICICLLLADHSTPQTCGHPLWMAPKICFS